MDQLGCSFPKLSRGYLLNYLQRPICPSLLSMSTIVFPHPSMQIANFGYMNEHTPSQTEDNTLLGD